MRQLYMETRKALRRGLESAGRSRRVHRTPQDGSVGEAASNAASTRERALALWDNPDPEFFMQHSVGADRVVDRSDRAPRPGHWPARARARRRRPCQRRRRHRDIPVHARPAAVVCRERDRDRPAGPFDSRRAHPYVGRQPVFQQLHRARRVRPFDQRERGALPSHRTHADRAAQRPRTTIPNSPSAAFRGV